MTLNKKINTDKIVFYAGRILALNLLLVSIVFMGKGLYFAQASYHNLDSQRNALLVTSHLTNSSAYDLQFQMSDIALGGTERTFATWYRFSWRLMKAGIGLLIAGVFCFGYAFCWLSMLLFDNEETRTKANKNRK